MEITEFFLRKSPSKRWFRNGSNSLPALSTCCFDRSLHCFVQLKSQRFFSAMFCALLQRNGDAERRRVSFGTGERQRCDSDVGTLCHRRRRASNAKLFLR